MTIDERRVTTALNTYAQGVHLSDEDLDHLEAGLHERLHPSRRRAERRPWEWAVAACAIVALVLAVTALWRTRVEEPMPATASITSEDLAGVWVVIAPDDVRWLWHFTADRRIAFSRNAQEYVTAAEHRTPYTTEGDVLAFSESGERCRATVTRPSDGRLTLTPVADTARCQVFAGGAVWDLMRVSPASMAAATLVVGPHPADQRPAAAPRHMTDIAGTWLFEGTGTVLVILRTSPSDGTYFLDVEGDGVDPGQRGRVLLSAEGGMVLRPTGEGEGCDTVYSRVVTTGDTLELEPRDSSCGRLGAAPGRLIRLN